MKLFYRLLLYATQLELALALSQEYRNARHIEVLQRDESEYNNALTRLELGL